MSTATTPKECPACKTPSEFLDVTIVVPGPTPQSAALFGILAYFANSGRLEAQGVQCQNCKTVFQTTSAQEKHDPESF